MLKHSAKLGDGMRDCSGARFCGVGKPVRTRRLRVTRALFGPHPRRAGGCLESRGGVSACQTAPVQPQRRLKDTDPV